MIIPYRPSCQGNGWIFQLSKQFSPIFARPRFCCGGSEVFSENNVMWLRKRKWWLIVIAILLIIYIFCLPSRLFTAPTSFVIEDNNGRLLSATIANDGQWRFPVDKPVPDKFAKCIIAYEDKRFNYHWGVDPIALARAVKQNLQHRTVISGGSTLSMQVIRLSRNKPRTIFQKACWPHGLNALILKKASYNYTPAMPLLGET